VLLGVVAAFRLPLIFEGPPNIMMLDKALKPKNIPHGCISGIGAVIRIVNNIMIMEAGVSKCVIDGSHHIRVFFLIWVGVHRQNSQLSELITMVITNREIVNGPPVKNKLIISDPAEKDINTK
jgi:hypothetical protein